VELKNSVVKKNFCNDKKIYVDKITESHVQKIVSCKKIEIRLMYLSILNRRPSWYYSAYSIYAV